MTNITNLARGIAAVNLEEAPQAVIRAMCSSESVARIATTTIM